MRKQLLISENHIMEVILKEFNDNATKVNFVFSNWFPVEHTDVNGEVKGNLLIQRMALNNDRFDVKDTFDEASYEVNQKEFTPFDFGNLNAEYLSHPKLSQVQYSPNVSILVSAENQATIKANTIALEEIRARFRQYSRTIDVLNLNLNKKRGSNEPDYIKEKYQAVFTAGEIDYGQMFTINGRNYIQMSIQLGIFVTLQGLLSNNQKLIFSTDAIVDNVGNPKKFEIPLISWHWGTVLETKDTQQIRGHLNTTTQNRKNSMEAKSTPQGKGFALSIFFMVDLDDEFQAYLYKGSIDDTIIIPTFTIDFETYKRNKETGELELFHTNTRDYLLSTNSPPEEITLGDPITLALTFTPKLNKR